MCLALGILKNMTPLQGKSDHLLETEPASLIASAIFSYQVKKHFFFKQIAVFLSLWKKLTS